MAKTPKRRQGSKHLNKLGPLADALTKAYKYHAIDQRTIQDASLLASDNKDISTIVQMLLTYSSIEALEWAEDNIERRTIIRDYNGKTPQWKVRADESSYHGGLPEDT